MKKNKYQNYFKNSYQISYKKSELELYKQWFYPQWEIVNRKITLKNGSQILEVGSGLGVLYSYLKDGGLTLNYEGLEIDRRAVLLTKKYFRNQKFKNTSFEDYKRSSKKDFIFAFEVLEHFENPMESIKKVYSLLKSSGMFVGTSPYPYIKNILACPTHYFVLHPINWSKLFLEAGFTKVELIPMSFFPFLWRVNRKFNPRLPFYTSFPRMISTCLIVANK